MKEETRNSIIEELKSKKSRILEHNRKVDRILELNKDPNVAEWISLRQELDNFDKINVSDDELIRSNYSNYLYGIDKEDTNKIYVYLGTYKYSNSSDGIRGYDSDISVDYNSLDADYRIFNDIELRDCDSIIVPIEDCEDFEKDNRIIYLKQGDRYLGRFYALQRDFFTDVIKYGQDTAVTRVLSKSNKI